LLASLNTVRQLLEASKVAKFTKLNTEEFLYQNKNSAFKYSYFLIYNPFLFSENIIKFWVTNFE